MVAVKTNDEGRFPCLKDELEFFTVSRLTGGLIKYCNELLYILVYKSHCIIIIIIIILLTYYFYECLILLVKLLLLLLKIYSN